MPAPVAPGRYDAASEPGVLSDAATTPTSPAQSTDAPLPDHGPQQLTMVAGGRHTRKGAPGLLPDPDAGEIRGVAKGTAPHAAPATGDRDPATGDRDQPRVPARNADGGKGRDPTKKATSATNKLTPTAIFTSRVGEDCGVAEDVKSAGTALNVAPAPGDRDPVTGDRDQPRVPASNADGGKGRNPTRKATSATKGTALHAAPATGDRDPVTGVRDLPGVPARNADGGKGRNPTKKATPADLPDGRKTRPGGQRARDNAPGDIILCLLAPPPPCLNKKKRPGGQPATSWQPPTVSAML